MRSTHTYAILEVSAPAYAEIRKLLTDAGYEHAFHDDVVDMHGIAIKANDDTAPHVPLAEIQAESARTNEANGVIAFLVGVIGEIEKAKTRQEASTIVEMARQSIAEWHAGLWKPGPHDDAANWRRTS